MNEKERLARAIIDRIERDGCVHLSSIFDEIDRSRLSMVVPTKPSNVIANLEGFFKAKPDELWHPDLFTISSVLRGGKS